MAKEHMLSKKELYKLYLKERDSLIAMEVEGAKTYDKAILTFTSGAFGVSIAFLEKVVPKPFPNTLLWLGLSWLCFAASLIIIILSFLSSQRACRLQVRLTYETIMNNKTIKNYWSVATYFCNYASLVLLMMAFAFSGLFIYWNKIYQP